MSAWWWRHRFALLGVSAGGASALLFVWGVRAGTDALVEGVAWQVLRDVWPVAAFVVLVAAGSWLALQSSSTLSGAARSARGRVKVVRIDAADWADAARHEAGHLAAFKRYGGKDLKARIYPDGSGWARAWMPDDTPVEHELAIDYAGGVAEGSWSHCGSDLAQARGRLREVGWWDRGGVESKGKKLARKATAWGATDRYRRKIERTGRW